MSGLDTEVSNDNGRADVPPEASTAHWRARLLALEVGPTYLNGVPVRRLACTPTRFEVALYELTATVGLGTGARMRITRVMTLHEAARHVLAGRCPHFLYSPSTDRWTETR